MIQEYLSSASQMVKLVSISTARGCIRRNRAHKEWKVPILREFVFVFPMSLVNRSRISLAALLVNVTAHMDSGAIPCVKISWAILDVRT